MNAAVSILLLAAVLGVIVFCSPGGRNSRRCCVQPLRPVGVRTDLPLDSVSTAWMTTAMPMSSSTRCRRENDGGFLLHLTPAPAHPAATGYPLYSAAGSRPSDGRDLIFVREAFLAGPLFPQAMLDRFMEQAERPPHQMILGKILFFCFDFLIY